MANTIRTIDGAYIDSLRVSAQNGLSAAAIASAGAASERLHVTPEGDVLLSRATMADGRGSVVLRGSIGALTYEILLGIELDGEQVAVTIDVQKPFNLPPYIWRFNLYGIVKDANGNTVEAKDVKPAAEMAAAGLDFLCVLKCGGLAVLGCLVKCLPAFAGGPPAYVACVTACAGEAAAGIAVCIATDCL